jgi:hypothetical protein
MCVTAIIAAGIATAGALGGMVMSIGAANARQDQAKWEAAVREKELYNQREAARLAALQQENARNDQFQRTRSSAFAAIGASGLGEHISFFNSIEPEAQKAFLRDVRSIRLNLANTNVSIADQVKVAEYGADIAKYDATVSKVGAIADFIKTAAQAATMYAGGAPGGAAGASSGGASDFGSNTSGLFSYSGGWGGHG